MGSESRREAVPALQAVAVAGQVLRTARRRQGRTPIVEPLDWPKGYLPFNLKNSSEPMSVNSNESGVYVPDCN